MLPSRRRFAAILPVFALVGFGACHPAGDPDGEVHSRTAAIIGGVADTTNNWVVGIEIGGAGVCSGSLIAPNLVLTARHCVSKTPSKLDCNPDGGLATNKVLSNYAASSLTVSTAQYYKNAPRWSVAAVRYINDAVCTGGSTDVACRLCGYDLALLELNKGTAFPTNYRAPSNVPPAKHAYQAMGYGCQKAEKLGCTPLGYRMLLDPATVVQITELDYVVSGRVCGGDSGGPTWDNPRSVILGALSRGDGDTATTEGCNFGIYTRADAHWDWIVKYGKAAATKGGYAALPWMALAKPPPDAGPPPPPPRKALGEPCTASTQCDSDLCVAYEGKQICSKRCKTTGECFPGVSCVSGYCVPVPELPPPEDTGVPVMDTGLEEDAGDEVGAETPEQTVKGGCAMEPGPGPKPQPWIVGLAVALLAFRRRR